MLISAAIIQSMASHIGSGRGCRSTVLSSSIRLAVSCERIISSVESNMVAYAPCCYETVGVNNTKKVRQMEHENVQKVTTSENCSAIFAANMTLFMKVNSISGNALAASSGIPQKTLWVTMNLKNIPTLDTCQRICNALSVDMRAMISRKLNEQEVQRTRRVGQVFDVLITLPSEKLSAAREIVEAFAK